MMRAAVFLWLSALVVFPVAAQTASAEPAVQPAAPAAPRPATVKVSLQTSEGAIMLEIETERAPITAANFLRYVDQKRLDGTRFYRAMKLTDEGDYGLIQGGVENDPKRVLKSIAHEPTSQTGLSNTDGVIAMARGAPGTASGDFFIAIGDLSSLDAKPSNPGDNLGFAAFGKVTAGMDIVHKIVMAPTSPTEGPEGMKGQILIAPVKIITARRIP